MKYNRKKTKVQQVVSLTPLSFIVYDRHGGEALTSPTLEKIDRDFAQEKVETKRELYDLRELLSHDTSNTRGELVTVLRQRADLIELNARTDHELQAQLF